MNFGENEKSPTKVREKYFYIKGIISDIIECFHCKKKDSLNNL